jgi:hypothetical protein
MLSKSYAVSGVGVVSVLELQMVGRRRRRRGASFLVAASVTVRLRSWLVEVRVSTSGR